MIMRSHENHLDIDDDVLQAAKEIAANRATTRRVLSDLVKAPAKRVPRVRNGSVMPRRPKGDRAHPRSRQSAARRGLIRRASMSTRW
jgi:hypothetical protein